MTHNKSKLFQPFIFNNGVSVRNRAVMAPMTTWSANPDGTISDQEIDYYRERSNGVGMVITGCTHVTPDGIGFTDEFASYDDYFIPSLRRLATATKSGGALSILQVFHAGNKAVPQLVPNGRVVSASTLKVPAGPFNGGDVTSEALNQNEIKEIILAFGETTRRAIEAGFDGIELHGAHGFLIQNFFSPFFNQRSDEWGGSLENRMRFPMAVVNEVHRVIAKYAKRPFIVGYRISPEESEEGGLRIDDTYALIDQLIESGVDYIHASLFDIKNAKPIDSSSEQTISKLLATHVDNRVPLIAAGLIRTPQDANEALEAGLQFAAIGQGLVMNPNWFELARDGLEKDINIALDPSHVPQLAIPDKLWEMIQVAKGWFKLTNEEPSSLN